jgi:hypothetical protein
MKYMVSWFERPQGSPTEYENAQKRILEIFSQWATARVSPVSPRCARCRVPSGSAWAASSESVKAPP